METEFKNSFLKDISSIKDKKMLTRLEQFIVAVENVDNLSQIPKKFIIVPELVTIVWD